MKLVVIDDENLIVVGLIQMIMSLQIPDLTVTGFNNAVKACEYLQNNQVDLAFVDINMEEMDGISLIQTAMQTNRDVRFVILSGYQKFSYAQSAIKLGVLEYLVKPIEADDLYRIVRNTFKEIHRIYPEEYFKDLLPADLAVFRLENRKNYSAQICKMLVYIYGHICGDVSLTKLSAVAGLHPNYVSSLFLKELNMNYLKYISGLKFHKTLELLAENETMSISEIAIKLGYYSERQFYRMFKQMAGITPGQYREKTHSKNLESHRRVQDENGRETSGAEANSFYHTR